MMDEIVLEVPRDITWNVHGQSNVVKAKENKKKNVSPKQTLFKGQQRHSSFKCAVPRPLDQRSPSMAMITSPSHDQLGSASIQWKQG